MLENYPNGNRKFVGWPFDHLNKVPEPRQSAKIEYPLDEILFLTISAVVSGCSEWDEIAD
ncbi:MAG: transposase family protein, partial [Saprospiraceae bacterium]|nr:transposase family protein [Saprospiraceae bacterium]